MANDSVQLTLQEAFADCKYCKGCDTWKSLNDFAGNPGNKRDGKQPICKRCSHSKLMAWHANNRDRYPNVCVICNNDFTSSRRNAKCCSPDCASKQGADAAARRHRAMAQAKPRPTCKRAACTNPIPAASASKYCSDTCRIGNRGYGVKSALRQAIEANNYAAIITAVRSEVTTNGPHYENKGPCWVWPTAKQKNGYPYFTYSSGPDRVYLQVHRLVLEAKHGKPLGSQAAHHMCANTACVNPNHLQPVTHRENMAEMLTRRSLTSRIRELEERLRHYNPNDPLLHVIEIA